MSSKASKARPVEGLLRAGILAASCVAILSSGMVLTLQDPPSPPALTFSEQALADAYADTEKLRLTGIALATAASTETVETAQLGRTVTLLTVQGQALHRPVPAATSQRVSEPAPSPVPTSAPAPAPASVSELVAGLAASAGERLHDAQAAEGGTARLLAAAGSGQLLQAQSLAAESGIPFAGLDMPASTQTVKTPAEASGTASAADPSATAAPASTTDPFAAASAQCPVPASSALSAALAAVLESERQADYGYQVALPRLSGEAAILATDAWSRHRDLAKDAASRLAAHCLDIPPAAPGYALDEEFLANPAGGLGAIEAGGLPVYGDLVALSDGPTREWAVLTLLESAQRAQRWGADPGMFPGLALEVSELPPLPDKTAVTAGTPTDNPAP